MKLDPRFTTRQFWADHDPYQPPSFPAAGVLAGQVLDLITQGTGLPPGSATLEVGAGNGAFSVAFAARFRLVALDLSHGLLSENPAALRVEGDVFRLPFANEAFDLVVASAMLHHVSDVSGALNALLADFFRALPLLAAYGVFKAEERGLLPFTAGWLSRQARNADLDVTAVFPFGWISPNKTPTALLPLFTRLPLRHPLGTNLLLIARKRT